MKKIVLTVAAGLAGFISTAVAQDDEIVIDKKVKKDKQEIIIRKKGDKDTKIVVELKGNDVIINGKPLSEFKDDDVVINKRNITIRGNGDNVFEIIPGEFMNGLNMWSDGKESSHAFLGVTTDEVEGGAKITNITKESAAEKAGLKEGDIIVKVNDQKIDGPESLSDAIGDMKPKDEAKVLYKRDGKEQSATAILGERKGEHAMSYYFSSPGHGEAFRLPSVPRVPKAPRTPRTPRIERWDDEDEGNKFEFYGDMFPRQQKLGIKIQDTEDGNGIKIIDVDEDSPAQKAGLKKDDIITEIAGKKVNNSDEAREQLHDNHDKAAYIIKAKRNGNEKSFDIKIPKKLKTANL